MEIEAENEPVVEANFEADSNQNENSNMEIERIERLADSKKKFLRDLDKDASNSEDEEKIFKAKEKKQVVAPEIKLKELIAKAEKYTLFLMDRKHNNITRKQKNNTQKQKNHTNIIKRQNKRSVIDDVDDKIVENELESEDEEYVRLEQQPTYLKGGILQPHQIIGLNWLISIYELGINGILADEMGLGKTIQTIALLAFLKEFKQISGPHLIVAPKSTLGNWYKELQKWLPCMRVIKLIATKEERQNIMEKYLKKDKFDVCLTSYEGLNICRSNLLKFNWIYIIVDEAHRLKNDESVLSKNLRLFSSDFKLLLTGTPLQNNLHELWSLLNFLLPDVFDCADIFDSWYEMNTIKSEISAEEKERRNIEMVSNFHKILKPFILRRTKADTQIELKPKKEIFLYFGLTDVQLNLYKNILLKKTAGLSDDKKFYMNIIMQLRKVCNHPYLFEGVEEEGSPVLGQHIINVAGKLIVLEKLLSKLKNDPNDTHQILLFCQMTKMLDILEDFCNYKSYQYCRIDGNTDIDSRDKQINEFTSENSKKFIFLLSTRAGGLGINLATADTVVLYDSDWNPQVDLQAMDRAHRIGQKKQVNVYRLITEDSIEEKIIERQMVKLKWDHLVIQQGRLQSKGKALGKDDLKEIVQFGASKIFKTGGKNLADEEIDALLDRSQAKASSYLKEMDAFLEKQKDGSINLSIESINVYKFQSIDYLQMKKNDEQAINEEYFRQIENDLKTRREKKTNEASKIKITGKIELKTITLADHHFYKNKARLCELLNKECELKYKARIVNKSTKDSDCSFQLSSEEQEEKQKLLESGFPSWTKQDLSYFISGCERFGRNEFEKIAELLAPKTVDEIKNYSAAFWERISELQDFQKLIARIEKGENTIHLRKKAQQLVLIFPQLLTQYYQICGRLRLMINVQNIKKLEMSSSLSLVFMQNQNQNFLLLSMINIQCIFLILKDMGIGQKQKIVQKESPYLNLIIFLNQERIVNCIKGFKAYSKYQKKKKNHLSLDKKINLKNRRANLQFTKKRGRRRGLCSQILLQKKSLKQLKIKNNQSNHPYQILLLMDQVNQKGQPQKIKKILMKLLKAGKKLKFKKMIIQLIKQLSLVNNCSKKETTQFSNNVLNYNQIQIFVFLVCFLILENSFFSFFHSQQPAYFLYQMFDRCCSKIIFILTCIIVNFYFAIAVYINVRLKSNVCTEFQNEKFS